MKIPFENTERSKEIGKNIAKFRQQAGLTQEAVAEILHIGNEAVSRIERGIIVPNAIRLLEFAHIFNCHVSDFFGEWETIVCRKSNQLEESLQTLSETDKLLVLEMIEKLVERLNR